jgi:hypothetical protein
VEFPTARNPAKAPVVNPLRSNAARNRAPGAASVMDACPRDGEAAKASFPSLPCFYHGLLTKNGGTPLYKLPKHQHIALVQKKPG